MIYATITKRLHSEADTGSASIVVNVTNGVVLLSGTVPSQKIRKKAEKMTRGIKDVKAVKNQITVQKR